MTTPEAPEIKHVSELPQFVLDQCMKLWGGKLPRDARAIVFTYYKAIYSLDAMPPDLYHHECTHYIQQGAGMNEEMAKKWWVDYCSDPLFRYQQELEAYRDQYRFIMKRGMKKAQAFNKAKGWAEELAGEMYGKVFPVHKALMDITKA